MNDTLKVLKRLYLKVGRDARKAERASEEAGTPYARGQYYGKARGFRTAQRYIREEIAKMGEQ